MACHSSIIVNKNKESITAVKIKNVCKKED